MLHTNYYPRCAHLLPAVACYMSALSSTVAPLALNTPALLVNRRAFDENHAVLRRLLADTPSVAIRPHTKAHKSGILAMEQLSALGPQAIGVCCQTVSEAEEMAGAGVADVLLTNQVVTAAKLERLLRLLSESRTLTHLGVLVDSDSGIDKLEEAIAGFGMSEATIPLSVWVEVDAGQGRCGVAPPPQSNEVLRLAQRIVDMATELTSSPASSASPSTTRLRFGGIQCYHGLIQFVHGREARHSAVQAGPVSAAKAARELLEKNGIAVPRVSGGGTGTFLDEASAGAHDEVQPGRSVQLFVSSLSLSLSFLRFSDNYDPCPTPWTISARHNKLLFFQTNHSRLLIRARPCCCRWLVPASPSWTQCTAQP